MRRAAKQLLKQVRSLRKRVKSGEDRITEYAVYWGDEELPPLQPGQIRYTLDWGTGSIEDDGEDDE